MEHKKVNRIVALGVFFVSLVTYVVTLSPTVVFWDVGEFSAAAYSLQVPHPPGAPLFLILARVASMIPFASDLAVRMHFISGFASAVACMILYLLAIRFILKWREEPQTTYDRIAVYGSAVIGALSLTFSPTFWFNAVEAEVYGMSMFFVSGMLWLGLRWYDRAHNERGDTYLLVIFYIVGLSVGVHLLALLALFPVMLLYYHKHYELSIRTFSAFGAVCLIIFGVVYLGVVKALPSLLDGEFGGTKSEIFAYLPFLLLGAAGYGVYDSIKKQNRVLNVVLLSFLFIVLGYSTYALVYVRANAKPPMNENDPSTMARLVSYINREQYGEAPLINRRWNTEPEQRAAQQKYTSDLDYFLKYQLDHMYLRYFGWNFVGSEGDFKEAGVDWKQLYGIPLFLGILGAFYHWRRDWKMASVATTAFLVLGLALVVYFNMQEPQPRERDYFYVGSFFIFSMWIGIGVLAIVDWIKERFQSSGGYALTGYGVLVLAFIFVPANMFRTNFHQANRTGNYVAWDYSYNLLQSCDQDAVLFTNGDNDTFPLWYLQDVEGVRRDVRVVCLSLLNTPWYIRQLKHEQPYGSKKVSMMTPDVEIDNIGPRQFEPRVIKLPVPGDVMRRFGVEGTAGSFAMKDKGTPAPDTISFFMPNTVQFGDVKAIRVQDIMVFDIVASSNWERPVYFAMTVSPDGQIGLRDYLQLEGLAFRLTPKKGTSYWSNINEYRMHAQLFTDVEKPSKTPALGYRWRGLDNKKTYFDEDVRRLMTNYRQAFGLLAQHYANMPGQSAKVAETLDRMEKLIPRNVIQMDYRTKIYVANLYNAAGKDDTFRALNDEIINELKPIVASGKVEPLSYDNPYVVLMQVYESMQMFDDALKLVDRIREVYSKETGIEQSVGQIRARLLAEQSAARKDSLREIRSLAVPTTENLTGEREVMATHSGGKERESRREHWETLWQEKKKDVGQVYSNEDRIVRQLSRVCELRGKRVLEVGAGTGRDSFPLIECGAEIVQLDYSVNSLQILKGLAEELNAQTKIVGGDTFQLPFRDETFDVVFHQGLLEHFRHPQARALLKENIRVLKQGGLLLVDVPQRYHVYTVVKHVFIAVDKWFAGWERSFSTPELTKLLQSLGLTTIHAYGEWMYPSLFYRAFRSALKKTGLTLPKNPQLIKPLATLRKNIRLSMLETSLPLYTGLSIGVIGKKQSGVHA